MRFARIVFLIAGVSGILVLAPLLARFGRARTGRACPLCPGISDVDLFRYRKYIVHFDPQISDGALDLGMAKQ